MVWVTWMCGGCACFPKCPCGARGQLSPGAILARARVDSVTLCLVSGDQQCPRTVVVHGVTAGLTCWVPAFQLFLLWVPLRYYRKILLGCRGPLFCISPPGVGALDPWLCLTPSSRSSSSLPPLTPLAPLSCSLSLFSTQGTGVDTYSHQMAPPHYVSPPCWRGAPCLYFWITDHPQLCTAPTPCPVPPWA